ncbi:MAG: hypothetical protein FIA92_00515 [Chloroflexi bacterium]|nr:hypothetical protein [Chloroflexota bacterium]
MVEKTPQLDNPGMDRLRRPSIRLALVIALTFLVAPTVVACGGGSEPDGWVGGPAAEHTPAMGDPAFDAAAQATWNVRPDYVRSHPRIEAAYAYALARPDVITWLPCYCGCVAMDHRSNLDCFFKPTQPGASLEFEEHASYCDVCVETALMAKQMLADGASLAEIRDEVDATFGGRAPGTVTPLPPA